MSLAICAIFRNEAPYIREWIEFHRIVGVERFYLYQNNSSDRWASAIAPYVKSAIVQVTDWPMPPPCHLQAYQDFIDKHKGKPEWVAFIDCDEFLFSPNCSTVTEALEKVASPDWGAVGVNWMTFGASGQEQPADGLVIERFTLRPADDFDSNLHIKSIVRMNRVGSIGRDPHHFQVKGGTFGESGCELSGPVSTRAISSWLRVNHYHTKSRQEYLRRISLGKADGQASRSPGEFEPYQASDRDDKTIWRFLPSLKQRLACMEAENPAPLPGLGLEYAPFAPAKAIESHQPPGKLAGYRGYHRGETILVCGCGASLAEIVAPERFTTIGVNDVGRLFDPDYLVVINPCSQFCADRFQYVEASRAKAVFTQLNLGISHPNIVRFRLGRKGGVDVSEDDSLPYTHNSPYVALCLALVMGAKRIGLIGVDFAENHFFAATGRHPLEAEMETINSEYARLAETCRQMGTEVYNLSAESRLTAFPKISPLDFTRSSLVPAHSVAALSGCKVFFVNYRFLSCGEVFSDGLTNAAMDLGISSASAYWDDCELPSKVERFRPDLLFVVHGRRYSQHLKSCPRSAPSAVWLLDEPYEVDDTSRFSTMFGTVFINDPSTLGRHNNAYFLPVCYDPAVYHYRPGPRPHRVGFIGGGSPSRERALEELAGRGLLSYTVGGPWGNSEIRHLSLGGNIPAARTAELYRNTTIVVNVFRTAHHYNQDQLPPVSMNPRIYEALGCGAIVVSERRPEIERLCPEMPVFDGLDEMVSTIEGLLNDPARLGAVRKSCIRRLAGHTYAHRLHTAIAATLSGRAGHLWTACSTPGPPAALSSPPVQARATAAASLPGWETAAQCVRFDEEGIVTLHTAKPLPPGTEAGLIGKETHGPVRLSFDVLMEPGAAFLAKVHQLQQRNQASNSYHLLISGRATYVGRHNCVLGPVPIRTGVWEAVSITYRDYTLSVEINGKVEFQSKEDLLESGYCFLGIRAGTARVRKVEVTVPGEFKPPCAMQDKITGPRREPEQSGGDTSRA